MDIENKVNCMRFENLDTGDVFVGTDNKIYMKIQIPEMHFPATMIVVDSSPDHNDIHFPEEILNTHFRYLAVNLETGEVIEIKPDTLILRISGKFTVTID